MQQACSGAGGRESTVSKGVCPGSLPEGTCRLAHILKIAGMKGFSRVRPCVSYLRRHRKQKWRPIPRLFPWRMAHNAIPRRYPLYKHRSLFLPVSVPSYSPQAAKCLPRTPLTITNNAANLPRTFELQRLLSRMQPVTHAAPFPAGHLSMSLPRRLRFHVGARDTVPESDFTSLSSRVLRGAGPGATRQHTVSDGTPANADERSPFSGSFVVLYSSDKSSAFLSLKDHLSRIAPDVVLEACQSTGNPREFRVKRRADNVVVFDSESERRFPRGGNAGERARSPEESTVAAAVRSILISAGL
ncbi:hypothetical protein CSUI_000570 [Cystoisospora suis]|uniref:Uncharacterized protein n=1 Tax=Cystoisospora suis TaxID=483139 RepID=A0A2C6LEY5_9APIC|nr:hypothetical protein CSUI_000570 [Cystoisospora suis]